MVVTIPTPTSAKRRGKKQCYKTKQKVQQKKHYTARLVSFAPLFPPRHVSITPLKQTFDPNTGKMPNKNKKEREQTKKKTETTKGSKEENHGEGKHTRGLLETKNKEARTLNTRASHAQASHSRASHVRSTACAPGQPSLLPSLRKVPADHSVVSRWPKKPEPKPRPKAQRQRCLHFPGNVPPAIHNSPPPSPPS